MKTSLFSPQETPAGRPDAASPDQLMTTAPTTQKAVFYFTSNLQFSQIWFEEFFTTRFRAGSGASVYPYLVAEVDEVIVYLTTDWQYRNLQPDFYWMVPTVGDVAAMRTAVANRPGTAQIEIAPENGTLVSQFVAVDDFGNRLGVINNPIYTPHLGEKAGA
ncbi:hypothetical protein [Hymenobacter algoricola]|uniref:VOC family protein n=1 Tax=Hymenobacter algoricola TaxID=486267 RepID=A0ABP7MB26_9BACT